MTSEAEIWTPWTEDLKGDPHYSREDSRNMWLKAEGYRQGVKDTEAKYAKLVAAAKIALDETPGSPLGEDVKDLLKAALENRGKTLLPKARTACPTGCK